MIRPQLFAVPALVCALAAASAVRADATFTFPGPASAPAPDGSGAYCNSVPLLLGYTLVSDPPLDTNSMNYSITYLDGDGVQQSLDNPGAQGSGGGDTNSGYVTTGPTGPLVGTFPFTLDSYASDEDNAFLAGGTTDITFESCGCEAPLAVSPPLAQDPVDTAAQVWCPSGNVSFFWTLLPDCHEPLDATPSFVVTYVNSSGTTESISSDSLSVSDAGDGTGGWLQFNLPSDVSGSVTFTFAALSPDDGSTLATTSATVALGDSGSCDGGGGGFSGVVAVCIPDGTQLFEDNWPENGDLDFNDQSVSYNYQFLLDDDLNLTQMLATFNVLSIGADTHNGLYLHLAGVPSTLDATFQLTTSDGQVSYPSPVVGETDLVIPIVDDTRELFPGAAGFINTVSTLPAITGNAIALLITFNDTSGAPVVENNLISGAPIDLFIAQTGNYGHQIHLPQYPGTDLADPTLFGSGDDGSSSAAGTWYVNKSGLPFALDVPIDIVWPQERVSIDQVYPDLTTFAQTGAPSDWYESTVNLGPAFTAGANGSTPPTPNLFMPALEGIYGSCVPNAFGGGPSTRAPSSGR